MRRHRGSPSNREQGAPGWQHDGIRRITVYALRKKYGLVGEEPSSRQVRIWAERTHELLETGKEPEEAGLVAARLEFETLGNGEQAPYVSVEDLLFMAATDRENLDDERRDGARDRGRAAGSRSSASDICRPERNVAST